MSIDSEKKVELFTRAMYAFCLLQFLFFVFFISTAKYMDKKLVLTLSAVFGLVLSSFVRQTHHAYLLRESSKPLDENILTDHTGKDQEKKNG